MLVLRDPAGHERIRLVARASDSSIDLLDESGTPQASLRSNREEVVLDFFQKAPKPTVSLGTTVAANGGGLEVTDGVGRVKFGISDAGGTKGWLSITTPSSGVSLVSSPATISALNLFLGPHAATLEASHERARLMIDDTQVEPTR